MIPGIPAKHTKQPNKAPPYVPQHPPGRRASLLQSQSQKDEINTRIAVIRVLITQSNNSLIKDVLLSQPVHLYISSKLIIVLPLRFFKCGCRFRTTYSSFFITSFKRAKNRKTLPSRWQTSAPASLSATAGSV